MKKIFILILLLTVCKVGYSAPPARISTYVTDTTISSTAVTGNEDAIFNYLQTGVDTYADNTIVNADINESAAIAASKLNITSVAQNITHSGTFTQSSSASFTTITDLGTVTTADINAGTWQGTIDGNWDATGQTCSDLGTVTTSILTSTDINGGTMDGVNIGTTTATGELIVNDASDDANGLGSQGTTGQYLASAGTGANPTWSAPPGNSNVIYQYVGSVSAQGSKEGEISGSDLSPADGTGTYRFMQTNSQTAKEILIGQFIKTTGVNTITIHAYLWCDNAGNDAICTVDIGGQNNTVSATTGTTTPAWVTTADVDVSGLTGTNDIAIKLHRTNADNSPCYLGGAVLTGS